MTNSDLSKYLPPLEHPAKLLGFFLMCLFWFAPIYFVTSLQPCFSFCDTKKSEACHIKKEGATELNRGLCAMRYNNILSDTAEGKHILCRSVGHALHELRIKTSINSAVINKAKMWSIITSVKFNNFILPKRKGGI